MCFTIDSNHPDIKKAETDMTCYKVLFELEPNKYTSMFKLFEYDGGMMYRINMDAPRRLDWQQEDVPAKHIEVGFHCYTSLYAVQYAHEFWSKESGFETETGIKYNCGKLVVAECIIPKDSDYYQSDNDSEYVSNQIKIVKTVKQAK